jgi:diguanylate cyclase (GGDEF)-like protein
MAALLRKLAARLAKGHPIGDDGQLYVFLVLFTATAFTLATHVAMTVFFVVLGVAVMVWLNFLSAVINVFTVILAWRRHYLIAGLLLSLEIIAYIITAELLLGFDTYLILYFFLVLIIQLIIPYANRIVRVVISLLVFALLVLQMQLESSFVAPLSLGDATALYSTVNILIAFLGVIAGLTVGNYAKALIEAAREARRAELESQAHTDPLTGLYNRRYAELYFDEIRVDRRGLTWCVAILDIDDFKVINDTHGHNQGDVVLKGLADYLVSTLRKSDIVFRWGGEEFLMLMSSVEAGVAHHVLDKVRLGLLTNEDLIERVGFVFTVTIGVAPLDLADIVESINHADRNLYVGKKNGKNQVVS